MQGVDLLSDLRQPRLRVLADNALLTGALEAEIVSNNHYAADRFRLTLQVTPIGAAAWSATTAALLEIQISVAGPDQSDSAWTSIILGQVDQVRLDPRSLRLVLEGRDLTAPLIEARTQETFANQTSSDIAAALAARHGLTANVAPTTTPVGAYWQLEHDRITLGSFSRAITEWDLLVALASHEGFDVWVSGHTLNFQPPPSGPSSIAIIRPVPTATGPANVAALQMERALTLARDIEVTVKSWNSRQANAFSQTARAARGGGGTGGKAAVQHYVYVVPNLTPDAAQKLAQSRLAELTRHERVILAEMPGELAILPRQEILLEGTGTAFDQPYWVDEITRRISTTHGFTQTLRARNSNILSQATTPADPNGAPPWNGF